MALKSGPLIPRRSTAQIKLFQQEAIAEGVGIAVPQAVAEALNAQPEQFAALRVLLDKIEANEDYDDMLAAMGLANALVNPQGHLVLTLANGTMFDAGYVVGSAGPAPTNQQLIALIEPLIPAPIKGDPGLSPTNEQLLALISSQLPVLGDIATRSAAEFASAAQGALASTAVQPADLQAYATDADLTALQALIPPAQIQSNWTQADTTKADYIKNKPALFSGAYSDLSGKPVIPPAQVNADWNASSGVAQILNKPVLFSGVYADLSGKPSLAAVATSGSYSDLTNRPVIPAAQVNSDWSATSGVAQILNKPTLFSGSYNDLSNKPTIPAAQVQTDWNATSGLGALLNKPALAAVALSGSYNDLTNKPAAAAAQVQSDWTETDNTQTDFIRNKPTLATVATTGSYTDLLNKPTVAQVATSGSYADLTNKPSIPSAYAVLKDVKSRLSTNSSGLWTKTYAVGFWTGEPSININPIAASAGAGQITWRTTKTLSNGAWTVTAQFTMLPVSVNILVLGSVNLGTSPGTVTFDYYAAEPNT